MTIVSHDSEPLKAFRAAGMELHEFSRKVERKLEEAGERGNLAEAKDALSQLTLRTKAFEELRARLTPLDLFVAKYCVMAHDEHTVSFVIPKGVSRIEILKEAQSISIALHEAKPEKYAVQQAIYHSCLEEWTTESSFTEVNLKSLALKIDGNVEGSINMTRGEQEAEGWNNVALQDLALAHTALYLLTGKDLFEDKIVRAAGGTLYFSRGLVIISYFDDYRDDSVSASLSLSAPN